MYFAFATIGFITFGCRMHHCYPNSPAGKLFLIENALLFNSILGLTRGIMIIKESGGRNIKENHETIL